MMKKLHQLLLATTLFVLVHSFAAEPIRTTVLSGANVIDVATGAAIQNGVIVMQGERITALGAHAEIKVPVNAHVIDLQGKWVIPALWDMHTHIQTAKELEVVFPLMVAHGVLGVRDMWGLTPAEFRTLGAAQKHAPRVIAAGKNPLRREGGTAAEQVAANVTGGADFIKVFESDSVEHFSEAAALAKRSDLHLVGHVPLRVGPIQAAKHGMRTIEHFTLYYMSASTAEAEFRQYRESLTTLPFERRIWDVAYPPIEPYLQTFSEDKASALVAALRENDVWQVPTLELVRAQHDGPFDDANHWANPDLALVPVAWKDAWRGENNRFLKGRSAEELRQIRERVMSWKAPLYDLVRRLHAGGVRFMAGTDVSAWNFMVPGRSLHDELKCFTDAGMMPLDALRTATLHPGIYLEEETQIDDAGRIVAGARADLLVLDADPREDIRNTRRIRAVVSAGEVLNRAELDGMLAEARARAAVWVTP